MGYMIEQLKKIRIGRPTLGDLFKDKHIALLAKGLSECFGNQRLTDENSDLKDRYANLKHMLLFQNRVLIPEKDQEIAEKSKQIAELNEKLSRALKPEDVLTISKVDAGKGLYISWKKYKAVVNRADKFEDLYEKEKAKTEQLQSQLKLYENLPAYVKQDS